LNRTLRLAGLLTGLMLACAAIPPAAQATTEKPAKLKRLRAEIARLQAQEASDLKRKHHVQAQLSTLEKKIADTTRALDNLAARMHSLESKQKTLQAKSARAKGRAHAASKELAAALRAAFVLGREPQLKLALNGDNPATVARMLGYYGYYSKARAARLMTLSRTVEHYQSLQQQLAATASDLHRATQRRQASLAELERTRQARQTIMAQLDRDIASKHNRATRLQRDATRLSELIDSVNQDLADVPTNLLNDVNFGELRGRLPWPIAGQLVNRYGSHRAGGDLTWEAVRIAAPTGTAIHAIAYGRVAYAGWLPYYGLVLMIDHGSGYLTVYGHNETIYKQVGDWVKPGDLVATVGASGGQEKPMLYFQIRYKGKTLNPQRWCANGHPPTH